jgi:anti-sigma-K factor RskA
LGTYDSRVLEITRPLTSGSTFGVTLEPSGGSPQPTMTPIIAYEITS